MANATNKTRTAKAAANVLVIEDDNDTCDTICLSLVREGFGVRTAETRDAALPILSTYIYDVIIMDYFMPGMGPEEFIAAVRQRTPRAQFILMTATAHAAEKAKGLGIAHWIGKPFEMDDLIDAIDDCSKRK